MQAAVNVAPDLDQNGLEIGRDRAGGGHRVGEAGLRRALASEDHPAAFVKVDRVTDVWEAA